MANSRHTTHKQQTRRLCFAGVAGCCTRDHAYHACCSTPATTPTMKAQLQAYVRWTHTTQGWTPRQSAATRTNTQQQLVKQRQQAPTSPHTDYCKQRNKCRQFNSNKVAQAPSPPTPQQTFECSCLDACHHTKPSRQPRSAQQPLSGGMRPQTAHAQLALSCCPHIHRPPAVLSCTPACGLEHCADRCLQLQQVLPSNVCAAYTASAPVCAATVALAVTLEAEWLDFVGVPGLEPFPLLMGVPAAGQHNTQQGMPSAHNTTFVSACLS
jgi:hypothetical protein